MTKHGASSTRLYHIWAAMKSRCNNPKHPNYRLYGGRGIKVCNAWNTSFAEFRQWSAANGYIPDAPRSHCTLDRIDVNGNYEPCNCRWTDQRTQCNNQRRNLHIEIHNETHTLSEWATLTGMPKQTIHARYKRGMRGSDLLRRRTYAVKRAD